MKHVSRKWMKKTLADSLKPKGTQTPRLYGLPKIHKSGLPLRPILSMIESPVHELAKWLAEVLKHIEAEVCHFGIKDTFQFIDVLRSINLTGTHLASFDVTSLFTNVPLLETVENIINICKEKKLELPIHLESLKELLLICTKDMQFIFDGQVYCQLDGVAMGSPLGPILANIFLGIQETKLKPYLESHAVIYRRFVDDTFFSSKK
jgi:hypothetical protein